MDEVALLAVAVEVDGDVLVAEAVVLNVGVLAEEVADSLEEVDEGEGVFITVAKTSTLTPISSTTATIASVRVTFFPGTSITSAILARAVGCSIGAAGPSF